MKENKQILITVIVPIYNTEPEQLAKCIHSVSNQSMHDLEILLVDDGSEYECHENIEKLAGEDDRIRVITKKNGGVSSARNEGLKQAKGKYIMFVDSDDWIDTECCQTSYDAAMTHKSDIVMWRYIKEFPAKSVEVKIYEENALCYDAWKQEFNPFDMRMMGMCWMKLYRKKAIEDIYFNENLTNGEDVEFNFRVFEKMHSAVYINEAFYHYRQSDNSAVRRYDRNTLRKYDNTINAMYRDVKCAKKKKRALTKAYYSFVGISYLVINMNYIFTDNNELSLNEKMKLLKKISSERPYNEAIDKAFSLELPITRKMALIFAKFDFYYGIYAIMFTKNLINQMRGSNANA